MSLSVYAKLQKLKETSSTNDKVALLKEFRDHEFEMVVKYTLDPILNFYMKKIPEYKTGTREITLSYGVINIVSTLTTRVYTGNKAINFVSDVLSRMEPEDADVVCLMIQRDLKCGINVGLVNKAWPRFIREWPCLLATPYNDKTKKNVKFPAIAQVKEDGMRVNAIVDPFAEVVEYRSRNGKEITIDSEELDETFVYLAKQLNVGVVVFDGELLCVDSDEELLPRSISNGICNKAIKGTITRAECRSLRVRVWDYVSHSAFVAGYCGIPYNVKFENLRSIVIYGKFSKVKYVQLVDFRIVENLEEAQEYFQEKLALGLEGIILKDFSMTWEDKRSKKQLKFKAEETADLVVVDWVEGKGKYQGMLGALSCESSDGKIKVNVSGFTDEQRGEITKEFALGKIIEVLYNTKIQDSKTGEWSLFLPRIVQFRDDKDHANSFEEIK